MCFCLGKKVNKHGGFFTPSSACFDSKRHESAAATAEEVRVGSFLSLHVQKWILCDKMVSMASRLKFFDAMITPVVCFGAGHRKIYTNFLCDLARGRALASPPQIPRCIGACLATPLGPDVDHCGPTLPLADVQCRKLLRRVVGPPADIDWNQPWHTILHAWQDRIDQQLEDHGCKIWSAKYLSAYWKFANYVALLDEKIAG